MEDEGEEEGSAGETGPTDERTDGRRGRDDARVKRAPFRAEPARRVNLNNEPSRAEPTRPPPPRPPDNDDILPSMRIDFRSRINSDTSADTGSTVVRQIKRNTLESLQKRESLRVSISKTTYRCSL